VVRSTTVNASEGRERKVVNAITIVATRAAMYSHADRTRSAEDNLNMKNTAILAVFARCWVITCGAVITAQTRAEKRGTTVIATYETRQRTSSARDGNMYDHAMQCMAPKAIPRIDGPKVARVECFPPEILFFTRQTRTWALCIRGRA
jgi:hypothetical protein